MNTKFVIIISAVVLVVGGLIGYNLGGSQSFGTTINPSNALNEQRLINDFQSITADLQSVRAPLANVVASTTASITFPAVSSTTTQGTTTVITGLAASNGDFILVSPNTPTAGVNFYGGVNTASTTSATFQITAVNASTSAATVTPTATTFNITVLPKASFTAPAALQTATST